MFGTIEQGTDGGIDRAGFGELVLALGIFVPLDEIDTMFSDIDTDGGGTIDFDEFVS